MNEETIRKCFDLSAREDPYRISEHLLFLGQIRKKLPFEKSYAIGKKYVDGTALEDRIEDDSALVYKGKDGLFIITGCSHAGICSIIEQAKEVCGENKILGVIGGFHLFDVDERLHKTIDYFEENGCHCVSLAAKIEMGKRLPIHEVGVGLELEIE